MASWLVISQCVLCTVSSMCNYMHPHRHSGNPSVCVGDRGYGSSSTTGAAAVGWWSACSQHPVRFQPSSGWATLPALFATQRALRFPALVCAGCLQPNVLGWLSAAGGWDGVQKITYASYIKDGSYGGATTAMESIPGMGRNRTEMMVANKVYGECPVSPCPAWHRGQCQQVPPASRGS